MDKHTICLLNDSFPPIIDGVATAVVNYAENIEKHHGHAVVVTPAVPGADDSGFPFPVVRYPSIDTRRLVGYVAGYPFSPETALRVREEKVELLHTHCPIASAILARSLREVVDAPLVLHGGSGLSDDDFRACVAGGISKINIFTHNNLTAARAAHTHFTESVGAFELMPFITEAVKHETMHHMRVFGSDGKA